MPKTLKKNWRKEVLEAATYAEFRKALLESGCLDCPLAKSRTHLVIDRGNPEAEIMLVGEAPGASEDLQGKPFVGRAGKLLDAMMKEIGIDTNADCMIANVLKCRPPGNRPPSKSEVEECLPFLHKQIELMKPRFVLLLGATAAKHLLACEKSGKASSMKARAGQFFKIDRYPQIDFMVLYHPAFILRFPARKSEMMKHLRAFKQRKGTRS